MDETAALSGTISNCDRRQVTRATLYPWDETRFTKVKTAHGAMSWVSPASPHRHRHFGRLLRARRKRASGRRTAEQRDELAALHSITSSARASSVGGISSLSALAVLRLMTRSNLTGNRTGRSPGFSPFKILSAKVAARR